MTNTPQPDPHRWDPITTSVNTQTRPLSRTVETRVRFPRQTKRAEADRSPRPCMTTAACPNVTTPSPAGRPRDQRHANHELACNEHRGGRRGTLEAGRAPHVAASQASSWRPVLGCVRGSASGSRSIGPTSCVVSYEWTNSSSPCPARSRSWRHRRQRRVCARSRCRRLCSTRWRRTWPCIPTDGLVFVNEGGRPIRRTAFGSAWRAAVAAAGAPAGTGFHDLRHFYASLLIRHGERRGGPGSARARERSRDARLLFAPVAEQ